MKKILIVSDLYALLWHEMTFLNREELKVFVATTNDEALKIHQAEPVDLIVTKLVMPGMPAEEFCSRIRDDARLRGVSLIMTCPDNPDAIKASSRCRANAVIPEPINRDLLIDRAQQLLSIATRRTLRVALTAEVISKTASNSFSCCTRDVSASGMLIETDQNLPAGMELFCQFSLPHGQQIEADCRIIRTVELMPGEGYQYGLTFIDMSDDIRRMLEEYTRVAAGELGFGA